MSDLQVIHRSLTRAPKMRHGSLIIQVVTVKVNGRSRSFFSRILVTMVTETEQNCFADDN